MKISQIIQETTTAGAIAPVESVGFVKMKSRGPTVYGDTTVNPLTKKKKGVYANSLNEGKVKQIAMDLMSGPDGLTDKEFKKKYGKSKEQMRQDMKNQPAKKAEPVKEADLHEEDKIISPDKGRKVKTGLHGKNTELTPLGKFRLPFKAEGLWVSDARGTSVLECVEHGLAPHVAKALNAYASLKESVPPAGTIAGGGFEESVEEGAKVDRMVKHIEKSERKLGKSKDEAENIAWATVNKRGYLDNKNKKKGK